MKLDLDLPPEDWPQVLVGLMEHIERNREALTTCEGCGCLVRPSEHCPICAVEAFLSDQQWEPWQQAYIKRWVTSRATEAGSVRPVDLWAIALALPLALFVVLCFARY